MNEAPGANHAMNVAVAALTLAFHNTQALLKAGLRSPAHCGVCAKALRDLCAQFPEEGGPDVTGTLDLIERLEAYQRALGPAALEEPDR